MQFPNFLLSLFYLSPHCPLCKNSLKWDGQLFFCPKEIKIDYRSVWYKFNYNFYSTYTKIDHRESFKKSITHFIMNKDKKTPLRIIFDNYIVLLKDNKFCLFYFTDHPSNILYITSLPIFKITSEDQLKQKINTYILFS